MTSHEENQMNNLVQQAKRLIEIDKNVVKAVVESKFDYIPSLISEFRKTKISVQKSFSELSVVETVDKDTHQILGRVQKTFPTDSIVNVMANDTGADSYHRQCLLSGHQ